MKNKSLKEYCNAINYIDDKKTKSKIELDTLFNFFKDLNKQPDADNDT